MSKIALVLIIQVQILCALNVSFPPKSLVYSLQKKGLQIEETTVLPDPIPTTQEIDITEVNVTNLSVEDINKIAEGLPVHNSTGRKSDVFIVYAQSVTEKAEGLPEQEAYIVEAQKLMSMVADDLNMEASNNYALAGRSKGTERLTPEERRNKLQNLFRPKSNLPQTTTPQETPKTKRFSYTDNFEPLKIQKTQNTTETQIQDQTSTTPQTYVNPPIRQQYTPPPEYFTPPARQQIPPTSFYQNPPNPNFEPPNKQFYGYVRHDLHLIDGGSKQPYLSLQQPVYQRNNLEPKNFQAHVQHPPIENPFRPVHNQFQGNPGNVYNNIDRNQFVNQGNFGNQQGYPLTPQQSFFGRVLPMFG